MAKQALMWEDPLAPCERRETKVVQLLRTGGAAWGVTEARSAFVYPRSLRPLRRIAGLGVGGGDVGADGDPKGSEVSQLLAAVFPRRISRGHIDDDSSACNDGSDDNNDRNNDITTNTATTGTNNTNNTNNNDNVRNNINTLSTIRNTSKALEVARGGGSTAPSTSDNDYTSAATSATGAAGNTPPIIARCRGKPAPKDKGAGDSGATKTRKVKKGRATARPVFYPYGNGNTAPSAGGVVYGGYMLSHSIIPQVLPNRPHTRQVHAGTQRVAVRAAAKAKNAVTDRTSGNVGASRIGSGRSHCNCNLRPTASKRGNTIYSRGGKNGEGSSRRMGGAVRGMEAVVGEEEGGGGGCGHQVFDPVVMFSALPEDPQPWCLAKDRRTGTTFSGQRARRRPSVSPGAWDELPPTPPPNVTTSPENCDDDQERASDSEGQRISPEPRSRSPSQPPNHEWTLDPRLANDPRNYKFLPRGWASELIVPAGVSGRRPTSTASFLPRAGGWMYDGKGVGVRRSAERGGADECGVGGCLRWSPDSS